MTKNRDEIFELGSIVLVVPIPPLLLLVRLDVSSLYCKLQLNSTMTTSKRLAERKVEKFQKNITRRGSVPDTYWKKGNDYPVGPILLGFFVFVVIGSSLFQIIRTASSRGMA